jgi:hypothetical protein
VQSAKSTWRWTASYYFRAGRSLIPPPRTFVSGKIASKRECSALLRRRSSLTGVSHQTGGMMKTLSTGQNNDGSEDRGRKARSHRRGRVLTAYDTNRRLRPNSEGYRKVRGQRRRSLAVIRLATASLSNSRHGERSRKNASDPPSRILRRGRHRWASREAELAGANESIRPLADRLSVNSYQEALSFKPSQ